MVPVKGKSQQGKFASASFCVHRDSMGFPAKTAPSHNCSDPAPCPSAQFPPKDAAFAEGRPGYSFLSPHRILPPSCSQRASRTPSHPALLSSAGQGT